MHLRPAEPADLPAILHLLRAAFPTDAEARLVQCLCANGHDELSLVALEGEEIVGHILYSPVTIEHEGKVVAEGLGLALVAVSPAHQKRGIGSALVQASLEALAASGCPLVVVLGEPEFYQRFGFEPASRHGIANEYGVDEPFMLIEFVPGAVPDSGVAVYGPEFAEL